MSGVVFEFVCVWSMSNEWTGNQCCGVMVLILFSTIFNLFYDFQYLWVGRLSGTHGTHSGAQCKV